MAGDPAKFRGAAPPPPVNDSARLPARHWLGFIFSGGAAFAVDASVLEIGVRLAGLHPLLARLCAISAAMVAGWILHRTFTFAVASAPSIREFARFATSAASAALLNYLTFAFLLIVTPAIPRLTALFVSSLAAMFYSYLSLRYVVFRVGRRNEGNHNADPPEGS